MSKIVCVVVTYNRLEKLKCALESYNNQTMLPQKLIVIDNHSTDGTIDYLRTWEKIKDNYEKECVYLTENTGGAGGFYEGIKKALESFCDWIYISDDDAYLEPNVIEKINLYAEKAESTLGAICGKVEENGGIGYFHRRIYKEGVLFLHECNLKDSDYSKEYVDLSTYSFVGTAVRAEAIWSIGLPNKKFFLWYDDTEHGVRMAKRYVVRLYPDIVIHHDVEKANLGVNWKKYYGYRNQLLMLKYNYNYIYFISQIFLLRISMIKDFFVAERRPLIRMKNQAIRDAKKNKTGLSDVYYPGVKIK